MALSNEDKSDVSRAFGKKAASAVSSATNDSAKRKYDAQTKALTRKMGKMFSGGPSKLTVLQEKRKAESIASDTGFHSKAETAKREQERKEHKERVKAHRAALERGEAPKNPYNSGKPRWPSN